MARGYGQYCPVALATEILGERWTILVITALIDGSSRFNDLQRALPRISATMLSARLRSLEEADLMTRTKLRRGEGHEYHLTKAGRDLEPIIMQIAYWGQRWARDMSADDLDPRFLAWSIHLRMNTQAMPSRRLVLEFEFSGAPADCGRFWIIAKDGVVDMCIRPPGYETDLRISSDLRRFVEAWRGLRSLQTEIRAGNIRLEGLREYRTAFPKWLLLSSAAQVARRRSGRERRLSTKPARHPRPRDRLD